MDTVIFGARNEAQLRDKSAAATWQLSEAEVTRLDEEALCRWLTPTGTSRSLRANGTHR